jgi:hypothetical protein
MKTYLDCWVQVAAALFSQALAGEPELASRCPSRLARDRIRLCRHAKRRPEGRFAVVLDGRFWRRRWSARAWIRRPAGRSCCARRPSAAAGDLLARRARNARWRALQRSLERLRSRTPFSSAQANARGRYWCDDEVEEHAAERRLLPPLANPGRRLRRPRLCRIRSLQTT